MGSSINSKRKLVLALAFTLALAGAGCRKKPPVAAAPPPPPPPSAPRAERPVIEAFEAEPGTVERGSAATLRWAVKGETTTVSIVPNVGNVNASGNRSVFPSANTTYELVAVGPGGEARATASVNVAAPVSATANPPKSDRTQSFEEIVRNSLQDAYFDYDKSDIREDARNALTKDADVLKTLFGQFPSGTVIIEGHADERGSAEYNLGLSDRRATAAREFLQELGVPAERLRVVARGKEAPECTEANESCWQRNRRAHFVAQP